MPAITVPRVTEAHLADSNECMTVFGLQMSGLTVCFSMFQLTCRDKMK